MGHVEGKVTPGGGLGIAHILGPTPWYRRLIGNIKYKASHLLGRK